MSKLTIPDSSVSLSRLGFGCARVFGGRESRASARLIETALKLGITHFDTAPSYGSESVLGEVLAGVREITITTKVGVSRAADDKPSVKSIVGPLYRSTLRPLFARMPALKSRLLRRRFRGNSGPPIEKRELKRDEVLRELEESLRRLRRTTVDVYLIHEPDSIRLTNELREVFLSLQRSGVIGSFGLAFGGRSDDVRFGQVVQCRYEADDARVGDREILRIYHGVVRGGMQAEPRGRQDASLLVREALNSNSSAAVIVSASTERQLRQLVEGGRL